MMSKACRIYLVRHGESVANAQNICGGDYPLTDKGRQQARELKATLHDVRFDAAYSSDLDRAVETASIIYGSPVPSDNQLPGLRERNFGSLENKSNEPWFEMAKNFEAQYRHIPFSERADISLADDIETDRQLQQRVQKTLEEIALNNTDKSVLAVSSAGPMRVILMELGFVDFLTPMSLTNTACIVLRIENNQLTVESVTGYVAG